MKILKKILTIKWFRTILCAIHFVICFFICIIIIWFGATNMNFKHTDKFDLSNPIFLYVLYFALAYILILILKFFIKFYYFEKIFKNHQMQQPTCLCPNHSVYKFNDAIKEIKKSFRNWWNG